jgi:3-ketosteroid 9alpha-monooxygenase subunit B
VTTNPSAAAAEAHHQDVLRTHGYHTVRVKQIVQETDDTRSFVLDIPDDLADLFRYVPGQFCTFRVHIAGDEQLRSYSMSSTPETDSDLTVTVKRVPGGLVSNWFLDRVAAGDVLELTKPAGVFCLRDDGQAPVVAFCGGSGVTPVMSIVKRALISTPRSVQVVYANRARDSVIFDSSLREWKSRYPDRFRIHHHFDTDAGFMSAEAISELAAGSLDADFYICGPGPFMDLVESTLLGLGVTPGQIFIERFVVDGHPAPAAEEEASAEITDAPEKLTIIMKGKRTAANYHPGDTVLETARRAGLQPPFSCESGSCATCMALLKDGSATMRVNNALTPEEVEEGWILTCQALPTSAEITVEYEAF